MVRMMLEQYIAHLNSLAFWREFTFSQNKFSPRPGIELELADNLVWFGDRAYVLQLKEREGGTGEPAAERVWFQKKVVKKATSQIRDSLRFLDEQGQINVTNERGHSFDILRSTLKEIIKIVVYLPDPALPEDCRNMRYYVSRSSGAFIHLLAANDYLGILEKLRVPEDIARYFAFREGVVPRLREVGTSVDEADIMGAFLNEEELPHNRSHETLQHFIQDLDAFDLSRMLGNIHDHIDRSTQPYEYYQILLEFARVPRSVWREVKVRFVKSLEAAAAARWEQPFRITFPSTDCTFMIAPLDPQLPSTGPEGEGIRITGLRNLTDAAMYLAHTSKGLGILISMDGEFVQIDWSLINLPWEPHEKMETRLAENNPFRPVSEKNLDSFLFNFPPGNN
jgi:hypothetical protein